MIAQDISWVNNTPVIRSYSSPRTTDLNTDGINLSTNYTLKDANNNVDLDLNYPIKDNHTSRISYSSTNNPFC